MVAHAVASMYGAASPEAYVARSIPGVVGALLVVGLWTPVTALLAAVASGWIAVTYPGGVTPWLLVTVVATALVLLGPGAWSIDAHLFGWKRVDLRGKGDAHSPD